MISLGGEVHSCHLFISQLGGMDSLIGSAPVEAGSIPEAATTRFAR